MACNSSYWDIDDILAEEELTPVTNMLDFRHLAHLDPDYVHGVGGPSVVENDDKGFQQSQSQSQPSKGKERYIRTAINTTLAKEKKFKMPLWSIKDWATTGFVTVHFPRHYRRNARERLGADPESADLRKRSERFFMSGISLIDLVQNRVRAIQSSKDPRTSRTKKREQSEQINKLTNEAQQLKYTLLLTFTGPRMRRTYDWTCSAIEDDVSAYTKKLTEMERRLFARGAAASHAYTMWKVHGSRRINISETALRTNVMSSSRSNTNLTTSSLEDKKTPNHKRSTSSNYVSPDDDRTTRGLGKRTRSVY
mmetsp:Transcript_9888/g.14885  ORF Transcript_9888/g.14885 Transcript_9888/m.14885 type:complete len:309 (-) Transcript_9888:187-1113(-)